MDVDKDMNMDIDRDVGMGPCKKSGNFSNKLCRICCVCADTMRMYTYNYIYMYNYYQRNWGLNHAKHPSLLNPFKNGRGFTHVTVMSPKMGT